MDSEGSGADVSADNVEARVVSTGSIVGSDRTQEAASNKIKKNNRSLVFMVINSSKFLF